MAYSKAQNKATQKYQKKAYQCFNLRFKTGEKIKYEEQAKAKKLSLNAYIISLLDNDT